MRVYGANSAVSHFLRAIAEGTQAIFYRLSLSISRYIGMYILAIFLQLTFIEA